MTRPSSQIRRRKDYAAEELVAALLSTPTFTFGEVFQTVNENLKARKVSSVGEDMLRLRVYERLQTFVSQGLVKKVGQQYTAVRSAVQALAADMEATKAHQERRKREVADVR